jgi:hypothetical protein
VLLALATAAAGFAVASLAYPILQRNAWNIQITGFVEVCEERERIDRITVRVYGTEGNSDEVPDRVRIWPCEMAAPLTQSTMPRTHIRARHTSRQASN